MIVAKVGVGRMPIGVGPVRDSSEKPRWPSIWVGEEEQHDD